MMKPLNQMKKIILELSPESIFVTVEQEEIMVILPVDEKEKRQLNQKVHHLSSANNHFHFFQQDHHTSQMQLQSEFLHL
jgi:hypothetical protein